MSEYERPSRELHINELMRGYHAALRTEEGDETLPKLQELGFQITHTPTFVEGRVEVAHTVLPVGWRVKTAHRTNTEIYDPEGNLVFTQRHIDGDREFARMKFAAR